MLLTFGQETPKTTEQTPDTRYHNYQDHLYSTNEHKHGSPEYKSADCWQLEQKDGTWG
jgi:hypothetical protein